MIELLVTMVILTIVVGSLTTVFVSGSSAEVTLNQRFQAQQNARLALDRIRTDIHCASAAQAQTINTYPGLKLAVGNCYRGDADRLVVRRSVTTTPPRYQLYRATGSGATDCTSSDATRVLIADYLTSSAMFTTAAIPQYSLQTVAVDLKIKRERDALVEERLRAQGLDRCPQLDALHRRRDVRDHGGAMIKRLRNEEGIALVMALGITVVLIIFVASMISYASQNLSNSNVSRSRVSAQSIAEGGISTAASTINKATNASDPTLLGCTAAAGGINSTTPCSDIAVSVPGGTAYMHGMYTQASNSGSWAITSYGSVTTRPARAR